MRPALLAALTVLPLLLAACTAPEPEPVAPAPDHRSLALRLSDGLPPMQWNASEGSAWWAGFVEATPKRDLLLPNNEVARERIASALAAAGFEVETRSYVPAPLPNALPKVLHVVVGAKPGLGNSSHAIALGGHYDTQGGTVYGAYDNGSGTAAVVQACQALAKVPMQHTLLCLLFDGEEEGTLGSQAFVADVAASGEWTIDTYLGFDMVGLNWPGKDPGADGKWRLFAWVSPEREQDLFPFVNDTFTDVLGYPPSGAEVFPFNDRNSDEAAFRAAEIPTIRFAGGRTAGLYPQYHKPGDTVAFVEEFAGGHNTWVKGFGAVVQTAYTQTLLLDRTDLAQMQAAT